jgi:hypothetical protein
MLVVAVAFFPLPRRRPTLMSVIILQRSWCTLRLEELELAYCLTPSTALAKVAKPSLPSVFESRKSVA